MPKRNTTPVNTGFKQIDQLFNDNIVNRTYIAGQMFPGMQPITAKTYLYKKLYRKEGQSFNTTDRNKVVTILAKYI